MKATELIEELQKFVEMYGDQPVSVPNLGETPSETMVPFYGIVPITDEEKSDEPKEFVLAGEDLFYSMYEEN